jgi:hypothetical protein
MFILSSRRNLVYKLQSLQYSVTIRSIRDPNFNLVIFLIHLLNRISVAVEWKAENRLVNRNIWFVESLRVPASLVVSPFKLMLTSFCSNMLPMLLAMGKSFPIIGDVISSLEGNRTPHPQRRGKASPSSQGYTNGRHSFENNDDDKSGERKGNKPFPEF